ncbi:alkaline phosphatase family protein [Peribacillus kribbensis]|uniref:alkaline phosphatase family protein n=1 Tax=Peribacillus kribbensis TaxID=356658 RepID=UPI00040B109D|nr:alkaline phosphatase family protein [Peribacillus kribbensis]
MYKALLSLIFLLAISGFMDTVSAAEPPQEQKGQTILISFDGMRNDLTRHYVKQGKLPHIKNLIEQGETAEKPKTITPSLTAPSHAAIATGERPSKTGIVSNQFHNREKPLRNVDDSFQAPLDTPPVWKEARKQGRTTATVIFPGANPRNGKQGDYSVFYGNAWSQSSLDTLLFTRAKNWRNAPKTFSPLKEALVKIKMKGKSSRELHILAFDSADDGKQNYEDFIVSEDKKVDSEDSFVKGQKWGSLKLNVDHSGTAGFWFKIRSTDSSLSGRVPIYRTAVTEGIYDGPSGFANEIKSRFGFFPPQDDTPALEKGWITRKEYEDISSRFVKWVADVSLFIKDTYKPDLLMFYEPQIDHEEHQFTLTDPRQPGYSKAKAKEYAGYIEWSYKLADQVIGRTMKHLNKNDNLLVVSDHGMEPAHTTLEPNKILKDKGLLAMGHNGKIDFRKSKAYAVPSSSVAHIYINLQSREKNGIVPQSRYEKTRSEIIKAFKQAEAEQVRNKAIFKNEWDELAGGLRDGQASFDLIAEHADNTWQLLRGGSVHPYEKIIRNSPRNKDFGHKNAGDIVLIGAEGYIMGSDIDQETKPAIELGTHGGDPSRENLRPVFFAKGKDFPEGREVPSMSNLKIAPQLYKLLGLQKPN